MKKLISIILIFSLFWVENTFAEPVIMFDSVGSGTGKIISGITLCKASTDQILISNIEKVTNVLFILCIVYIVVVLIRLFLARKENLKVKKKIFNKIWFGFLGMFIVFVLYSIVTYVISRILRDGVDEIVDFVFGIVMR